MLRNQNTLVILAGGTGSRFSENINKSMIKIDGLELWEYVLRHYQRLGCISKVFIVAHKEIERSIRERLIAVEHEFLLKSVVIPGGETRQLSCWNALRHADNRKTGKIIFQEAARPLVYPSIIENGLAQLDEFEGALAVSKSRDGLLNIGSDGLVKSPQSRDTTVCGVGPEFFQYQSIYEAHKMALSENSIEFAENCGLLATYGGRIKTFETRLPNLKVTHPNDFDYVKAIIRGRNDI